MKLLRTGLIGTLSAVFAQGTAIAAPEEVQVYMDELNAPGEVGLDIHNNYVLSGDSALSYPGEQASVHRYRFTPEWSLGLDKSLELGAYLPLASVDGGRLFVDGLKFRLKWLAPRRHDRNWFWGANFELGRVDRHLDENPWNAELKGILGLHSGKVTVGANVNLDFKVSGAAPAPASLEIATKLSYSISTKTAIGVENYSGLGGIRRLGRFTENEQSTYITADTSVGVWDFNFGVGRGYGSNPDRWIAKAIVSVPIGWSLDRHRSISADFDGISYRSIAR